MKILKNIRALSLSVFFTMLLPLSSGAVQLVAPTGDATANGWTTAPLFSKVNDYATDTTNATWIRSANGNTSFAVLNLGSMATPASTSCTVRYYANASGTGGPEKITLDIYQGGASVSAGAQTSSNLTRGSYNPYTATLNVTGATDWGALQVALAANSVGAAEYVMVSRVEVECPDPDTTKPAVTAFSATTPSTSLNIPIPAFTASDNIAVTGYLITTDTTPPASGAGGWTGSAPATYTVGGDGTYTLYPWAKDGAGNVSDVYGSPVTVVVDTTAPGVSSTVPVNGAGSVPPDSQVTINFSENVNCSTVNTTNITSTSPGWAFSSCSGSQAIFTTSGQANSTSYSVNVTTAVTDVAGNPLNAAYPFSYTTAAAGDTTPPTVVSTTPTNGATDVVLNSQVTINWDENIDCTTVNTTNITSTSPGWSLSSCSGSQAIFNTAGQANSTAYSVNVTTGVKDPAGNAMSAAYPFSYTTAASGADAIIPKVISFLATTPVATSVNIPVTVFTATDNIAVTGYMITASSTPPGAGDPAWTGTAPATFTAAAGDGTKTLYPWVKDAAGNVSAVFGSPASVIVDGTAPTDGNLTVTAGDTLNALSWTAANDGTGVGLRTTGRYEVRFAAGATAPADCASGTSLYTGNNLSFTHSGLTNTSQYSYRVCAYDALDNVSTGKTGSGTPVAAPTPTLSETTVKWTSPYKVSSAKTTTATLGATINAGGTSAITARGVVWSATNTNPTIGAGGVTTVPGSGTALGAFTVNVTALPKASQIYFQGYATNSSGTTYSGVISFWSEPDTAAAPTVNALIPGENYFDLTVNYTKPANADGVLVVVRQSFAPKTPPFDGTLYTADARIGSGSTTDPACALYCESVIADAAADGTVTVTGLKAGTSHYFAVYAYKGSGSGVSGINYVQTITATMKATAAVPLAGRSHNELWVAAASPKDGVNWGTETSTDCANCHGSHHTSQLLPTGVDMYDKCYTCHQDGGAADDNTADAKINMALHLSDGSVDCGTCHSMHSFRTEELFSEDNQGNKGFNIAFVRANMAKYFNSGNGFATNALEPTVFQNRPADFANAAADPPYNAVCQTCHIDMARTPHHQQVATDEHQTGMDCMTCHTHRNSAGKMGGFAPGGHDATHFPWDGTTQASCGTVGCHDFAANPDVVGDVHGGVCTVCHSNAGGGDGTAKAGDATFGIDGSALLADPVNHTENCLVCHPAATYDRSTVHHTSKNGYAAAGDCTQCHAGTNYPGDHSARVSLATNCADCHTGTQGSAGGIPVDPVDATVAARKVHDACTTCHNTDNDATLRLPYGVAQAMPDGGAGSGNGGGSCESCHTSGFGGYHATVGHATTVNTYVNCATCHTATAGTASDIPTSVADNKVHDACTTCHGADGRLINSAATHNGGTDGGSDAVNNCSTCHNEYFSSHTNIDHTAYVAAGSLICTDCHTATAGTTTTVPVDPANNKKHDACSTCHQDTGVLKTFALADTHNPDWIAAMPAGGGNCTACHGATFFTSSHSSTHDAKFYYDTTGTGASVDILQNNGSAGCAACHNDAGASLATFAAISQEHLNDCNKCHTETRDINESAATGTTVRQWIAARAAETTTDTNCRTCHVPNWNNVPNHAGHNATDFAWDATTQTSCGAVGCHDYTVNTDVVNDIHGGTCTVCHSSASGGDGTTKIGSATNGVDGDATLGSTATPHTDNCLVCHNIADADVNAASIGGIHHDNKTDGTVTEAKCTSKCHTVTGFKGAHTTNIAGTTNCTTCHTATGGDATDAAQINGTDPKVHDGCTLSCHNISALPGAAGVLKAITAPGGSANIAVGNCNGCHGAYFSSHTNANHTTLVSTTGICADCHTATAGTATTVPVDGANNMKHDSCGTCHNTTTGALLAFATADTHNPDWIAAMPAGGGNCAACHGATYFSNAGNHYRTHDAKFYYDTTGTGANVDILQNNGSAGCASCHNDAAAALATFAAINTEHLSNCDKCHTETRDINETTASGTTVRQLIANRYLEGSVTDTNCRTCHVPNWTNSPNHAAIDHIAMGKATFVAQCAGCHDQGNAGDDARMMAIHNASGQGCGTCHVNPLGGGQLVDKSGGGTYASQGKNYEASNPAGGSCVICHDAYGTNFQTGHWAEDHRNAANTADMLAVTASCTANCHTAATAATIISGTHKNTCTSCHTNTTTDGRLKAGVSNGTAANHVIDTASTCINCHGGAYSYDSNFETAHDVKDHTGMAALASCTTNCHSAATIANNITVTHKNNCVNCHSNTTTDGRLVNGAANAGSYGGTAQNRGDATLGTGDCAKCHGATGSYNYDSQFATAHIVEDHTGITYTATVDTGIQSNDCQDCHNQTTAAAIISTTHKNACADCHTNTTSDGRLIAGNTAGSYNGTTSVGDATLHTPLGATSGCITCHATAYFSNTNTPKHTNGTSNAGVHRVAIDGDTSGGQTCSTAGCHAGQSENWTNILTRHDLSATDTDVCHVCHDSTRTTNTSTTGVQNEITTALGRTVITSCLECHADKSASHGNPHKSGDTKVQNTAACMTCHPETNGPVQDIHGNQCSLCHVAAGGGGPLIAYLETNWPTGGTCAQCHFAAATGAGHHGYLTNASGRTTGPAPNGLCINCHKPDVGNGPVDPSSLTVHTAITVGNSLACNWCHLYWNRPTQVGGPGNGYEVVSGKVQIHKITWAPNTTPNVPATVSAIASHAISTNATTPISDYFACLNCHGATSATKGGGFRVTPFHGLGGTAVYNKEDGVAVNANDNINIYAGPTSTGPNQAAHAYARHPGFKSGVHIIREWVSPDGSHTTVSDGKTYYNGSSANKKIYDPDSKVNGFAGTTFNIPWDNFAAATTTAPKNVNLNLGVPMGTLPVPTTMPTVKVNLP